MKICYHKYCFLLLAIITTSFVGKSQSQDVDFYKGNPWIFSYGINLIFEDRNQFVNYLDKNEILWNFGSFTFGAEKRLSEKIALCSLIGSNVYPENQNINSNRIKTARDVVFGDLFAKLNFNSILKYKSNFDPYATAGTGYLYRSVSNEINLNFSAGFNYWLNNNIGITLNGIYKINKGINQENIESDLFQLNFMLVQIID